MLIVWQGIHYSFSGTRYTVRKCRKTFARSKTTSFLNKTVALHLSPLSAETLTGFPFSQPIKLPLTVHWIPRRYPGTSTPPPPHPPHGKAGWRLVVLEKSPVLLRIRIQVFDDQKSKKLIQLKKIFLFLSKIAIHLSPGHRKGRPSYRRRLRLKFICRLAIFQIITCRFRMTWGIKVNWICICFGLRGTLPLNVVIYINQTCHKTGSPPRRLLLHFYTIFFDLKIRWLSMTEIKKTLPLQ